MSAHDKANELLRQFGEAVGVKGMGLDADGTAVVTFDKFFVLFGVSDQDAALKITTALPDSEGAKSPRLLEGLLIANAHGEGANGFTVAIDGPAGPVILLHSLPLGDLRYHDFEAVLGGFISAATALDARIQLARAELAKSDDVVSHEAIDEMFIIKA